MPAPSSHRPCKRRASRKAARRTWAIFSTDQQITTIHASSLRVALRRCQVDEGEILAAVETACLPVPDGDARPFLAVLLRNPHYIPPEKL